MLRKTPNVEYVPTPATEAKPKPECKISFYADCPDGQTNKRFTYKVHDLSHSVDLLERFKQNSFVIRAAWFTYETGRQMKLPPI